MLTELSGIWTEKCTKPRDEIPPENSNNLGQIVHIWYLLIELFRVAISERQLFLLFSAKAFFILFSFLFILRELSLISVNSSSYRETQKILRKRDFFFLFMLSSPQSFLFHILTVLSIWSFSQSSHASTAVLDTFSD